MQKLQFHLCEPSEMELQECPKKTSVRRNSLKCQNSIWTLPYLAFRTNLSRGVVEARKQQSIMNM